MIIARFLFGLGFFGISAYSFMHDPQYTITGYVFACLGLLVWGLGEAIGDIIDD